MNSEGLKASLLSKDGQTAESMGTGLLQDIGVLMPLNSATGLIDFVPIRGTDPDDRPTITEDMLAGGLPEIERRRASSPRAA